MISERNLEKHQEILKHDRSLRNADLNLLTVFDAVMQFQNITRAAESMGMSQPAVSNAVSRLKVMFNDDLFVRHGRGIEPTARAKALFGPVRQALQLVLNELPGGGFDPQSSCRRFNMIISTPLDCRLSADIFTALEQASSTVEIRLQNVISENIEHQLRFRDIEFVIGYRKFEGADFCNQALFEDEVVLVTAENHPRITEYVSMESLLIEKHAVVMPGHGSLPDLPYESSYELQQRIAYQGTDLHSVIDIVSKTQLVAVVPRWLASYSAERTPLNIVTLPCCNNSITCYLSWHDSVGKDSGNMWLKDLLTENLTGD
jgi:LysR family transcriptional activator for leuABCD operon